MLNLNKTRLDANRVVNGTYWEVVVNPENGTLVARPIPGPSVKAGWLRIVAPGTRFLRAREDAMQQHLDAVREGKLTPAQEALIEGTSLVEGGVLVEWGNFTIGSTPVPFSKEKALEMLTDVAWANLRQLVSAVADDRKSLLDRQDRDAEGNSSADLTPSSSDPGQVGSKTSSNGSLNAGNA